MIELALNADTGQVSVLNAVGAQIWELMDGDTALSEIVSAVEQRFDMPREQAEADVVTFVTGLLKRDMMVWEIDKSG